MARKPHNADLIVELSKVLSDAATIIAEQWESGTIDANVYEDWNTRMELVFAKTERFRNANVGE